MLSLSSIEILLGIGLVSILPLVFVVLRATMARMMQHNAQQGSTSTHQTQQDAKLGKTTPLHSHVAAARAKSQQNAPRRDRAA